MRLLEEEVVAIVELPETFKLPVIIWLPIMLLLPETVRLEIVEVARVEVPFTESCPSNIWLPVNSADPTTVSALPGVLVPMPKFPTEETVRSVEPLVEAIVKMLFGEEVATIVKREDGTLVPTPMLSPDINNTDCGVTVGAELW